LRQNFDIALASFRKLDDPCGDDFVAEVAWALNGRASHFECDAQETGGLRIEGWSVKKGLMGTGGPPQSRLNQSCSRHSAASSRLPFRLPWFEAVRAVMLPFSSAPPLPKAGSDAVSRFSQERHSP